MHKQRTEFVRRVPTTMIASLALVATLALTALGCGGGSDDREALIEDRVRIGNTQAQAECYADAVIAEFGGDPANDGELSDDDVSKLLGFASGCVSDADG